ncbi:MAG: ribonuclease P protein component [Propionibacteriaceae bacterium]|nr:ribonuclease P protein component [Propionibacteriaceae bacterium]
MLPQHLRLRKSADIMSVTRTGRRVPRPTLVLHALPSQTPAFGVIVGRRVGNAVKRNRVKRILRHGARELILNSQPMEVVVRALPCEGDLRSDLTTAWAEAHRKVHP